VFDSDCIVPESINADLTLTVKGQFLNESKLNWTDENGLHYETDQGIYCHLLESNLKTVNLIGY